jgi:hypothetical protein
MKPSDLQKIEEAKEAALEVLLHNAAGQFGGLPRTAGWGYPEPYTRDLLFSIFGIAVSENKVLLETIRKVLETLAQNQSIHGHIPSMVHESENRGASDTTPLFLLAVGIYRKITGENNFLDKAVNKALLWMDYQSPSDRYLVAQQPTSDWRDEQWILGYGLYVNTLVYSYLKLFGEHHKATLIREKINQVAFTKGITGNIEGFVLPGKPYYALWSYKIYNSERFDLLGNSIAILSGIASSEKANEIITWIEQECSEMRKKGELAGELPPNFFPFVKPDDADWQLRYQTYNMPGEYHNGGIWPFVCGFYIAALVATKKFELAEQKLLALTRIVKMAKSSNIGFGFNEWIKAQDGRPTGEDWQTWSAALYLYAAKSVENRSTPFFDELRTG